MANDKEALPILPSPGSVTVPVPPGLSVMVTHAVALPRGLPS